MAASWSGYPDNRSQHHVTRASAGSANPQAPAKSLQRSKSKYPTEDDILPDGNILAKMETSSQRSKYPAKDGNILPNGNILPKMETSSQRWKHPRKDGNIHPKMETFTRRWKHLPRDRSSYLPMGSHTKRGTTFCGKPMCGAKGPRQKPQKELGTGICLYIVTEIISSDKSLFLWKNWHPCTQVRNVLPKIETSYCT